MSTSENQAGMCVSWDCRALALGESRCSEVFRNRSGKRSPSAPVLCPPLEPSGTRKLSLFGEILLGEMNRPFEAPLSSSQVCLYGFLHCGIAHLPGSSPIWRLFTNAGNSGRIPHLQEIFFSGIAGNESNMRANAIAKKHPGRSDAPGLW